MATQRQDDAYERSFTAIAAKTADITGEFKTEFLKKAGCRCEQGFFSFKTLAIAVSAHLLAQAGVHTEALLSGEYPDNKSYTKALSANDASIGGAQYDLSAYAYAEIDGVSMYVLTIEDEHFTLYTASEGPDVAFTLIQDYESAHNAILQHIIPSLGKGEFGTATGEAAGFDYIEFCPFISEPAAAGEIVSRNIECSAYPSSDSEIADLRVAAREVFWNEALSQMNSSNYGYSIAEIEALPHADAGFSDEFIENVEQGASYGGIFMASWFLIAGIGAAGAMAQRRRDEHYQKKNPHFKP